MRDFWLIVAGVGWSLFVCFPTWGRSAGPVKPDEHGAAGASPDTVEGDELLGWVDAGRAELCGWDEYPDALLASAPDCPPAVLGVVPAPFLHGGARVASRGFHGLSITNKDAGP